MTNREIATLTLENLAKALEACGIEATVEEKSDHVILTAPICSCQDSSTHRLEVWACEETDYEVESCANPLSTIAKVVKSL